MQPMINRKLPIMVNFFIYKSFLQNKEKKNEKRADFVHRKPITLYSEEKYVSDV